MTTDNLPSTARGQNLARAIIAARKRGRLETLLDVCKALLDLSPDGFREWLTAELRRAKE